MLAIHNYLHSVWNIMDAESQKDALMAWDVSVALFLFLQNSIFFISLLTWILSSAKVCMTNSSLKKRLQNFYLLVRSQYFLQCVLLEPAPQQILKNTKETPEVDDNYV